MIIMLFFSVEQDMRADETKIEMKQIDVTFTSNNFIGSLIIGIIMYDMYTMIEVTLAGQLHYVRMIWLYYYKFAASILVTMILYSGNVLW